ncbi:MAG: MBL fold metallo-hydrolase [Thermoanaerobaculia bacterium]
MARLLDRLAENVEGDLYVDRTCIDCATCRELLPSVYEEGNGYSFVAAQPTSESDRRRALMALIACPTGSIGTVSRADIKPLLGAFPEPVVENIHFCGYTSKDSFGAWSYLITRPEGNILIDSPRAAEPLVKRIREMGGVSLLALTHQDDVADHDRFHRLFGCDRVIHLDDSRAVPDAERKVAGLEPIALTADLLMIPTPGHTRGHAAFLYENRYLFTGDHLAWSERREHLIGFRSACWYSWSEQITSMERLLAYDFEWVLPGHGMRYQAPSAATMRRELERCIAWMKTPG